MLKINKTGQNVLKSSTKIKKLHFSPNHFDFSIYDDVIKKLKKFYDDVMNENKLIRPNVIPAWFLYDRVINKI